MGSSAVSTASRTSLLERSPLRLDERMHGEVRRAGGGVGEGGGPVGSGERSPRWRLGEAERAVAQEDAGEAARGVAKPELGESGLGKGGDGGGGRRQRRGQRSGRRAGGSGAGSHQVGTRRSSGSRRHSLLGMSGCGGGASRRSGALKADRGRGDAGRDGIADGGEAGDGGEGAGREGATDSTGVAARAGEITCAISDDCARVE